MTADAGAVERVFFALWPDDLVRRRLGVWARAAHARCGGRLMRERNIHLTIAFLGDTDAARMDALAGAVADVAPRRFTLTIDRTAYWKHNRIVWAGTDQVPPALEALVGDLRGALDAAGFRYDAKPFVPHVTLVRNARHAPLPPLDAVDWRVAAFVLVRSVQGERGSDYEVVAEWS